MLNLDIRTKLLTHGITQRQLSKALNVKPSNLCAALNSELSPAKRQQILVAIDQLIEQGGKADE